MPSEKTSHAEPIQNNPLLQEAQSNLASQLAELGSAKPNHRNDGIDPSTEPAPFLDAAMSRLAYFGVQGRLFPSMSQIKSVMATSGPVGEAALARMAELESHGWKFGAMGINDPYLKAQSPGLGERAMKMVMLGGYNDLARGKITYNPIAGSIYTTFGMVAGADRDAAAKYIHELAHGQYHEGWSAYESDAAAKKAFAELSPAEKTAHGNKMLAEELRAITAQTAGNIRMNEGLASKLLPHVKGLSNLAPELALKHDYAGAFVQKTWGYEGTRALSPAEATTSARQYLSESLGYEGGKITPAVERAIAKQVELVPLNMVPGEGSFRSGLLSPRTSEIMSQGGQRLGSFLLAATSTHVLSSFSEGGAAVGVSRLAGVGLNWAAFEGGAAAGTWFGVGLSRVAGRYSPRLAMIMLPVTAICTGVLAAETERATFGRNLETAVKRKLQGF